MSSFVCAASGSEQAKMEFFEKNIRPLLAKHCYECHSSTSKKLKGGLMLDHREGWATGGDSGPALLPGNPEESLLIEAVRYENADLEMPPSGRLSRSEITQLETWITNGATDPRTSSPKQTTSRSGSILELARTHWAYQPISDPEIPHATQSSWPKTEIDKFIQARWDKEKLQPAADTNPRDLLRRLYYDLTGLPPTPEQIDRFLADPSLQAYERLVDQLLASPHFGERWGRHWLDVVRYGESVTLRGLVFPNAWRYRDYVINAFNEDMPFDQFVREQIAGDLIPADNLQGRQRQLTATTFLTMGNSNLENQDKSQLEMDVIDEQLDVISKAFLAQTVTCARCHDHKFDPIPTHDYYALAGILKGANTLAHANVSGWVEVPLPLPEEEESQYKKNKEESSHLNKQIKELKKTLTKIKEDLAQHSPSELEALSPTNLVGFLVDSSEASRQGTWKLSQYTKRFIGDGYLHDLNEDKGTKSLTFTTTLPKTGLYEVRFAYSQHKGRETRAPLTVHSAEGNKTVQINQQTPPPIDSRFVSLGIYRFDNRQPATVVLHNTNTSSVVTADAVQFIPLPPDADPSLKTISLSSLKEQSPRKNDHSAKERKQQQAKVEQELKGLESNLRVLEKNLPPRPMVMSVEEKNAGDIAIRIRGDVHNKGSKVPRGFLQALPLPHVTEIPLEQSGRKQLAEWLAHPDNPLTSRVLVNRVWHWLFGTGLVRTPDNFGTTGQLPTHPELLDYLTAKFMREGWSVKKLVHTLVTSRVYQLASDPPKANLALDPGNKWFSHANKRRLDAEALRDTLLFVGGRLDTDMGGSTVPPGLKSDYGKHYQGNRRSVYVPIFRNALPEIFEVFDFADPSMVVGARNNSTVAPQALYLMNHPFVQEQSRHTAERLLKNSSLSPRERILRAYQLILGRPPSTTEYALALDFLSPEVSQENFPQTNKDAWEQMVQALFGTLDFRYLN